MKNSRRDFIRKSLATVTGTIILPQIIPASALGRNGFMAPSDRIVMGSIGVGSQGTGNMKDFLKFKEVQWVAVCDVDSKHVENAAAIVNKSYNNSDCQKYKDYRDLLEKEKLDAARLLDDNDGYGFFSALGDLVVTGPTRTNVNDFRAILVA